MVFWRIHLLTQDDQAAFMVDMNIDNILSVHAFEDRGRQLSDALSLFGGKHQRCLDVDGPCWNRQVGRSGGRSLCVIDDLDRRATTTIPLCRGLGFRRARVGLCGVGDGRRDFELESENGCWTRRAAERTEKGCSCGAVEEGEVVGVWQGRFLRAGGGGAGAEQLEGGS